MTLCAATHPTPLPQAVLIMSRRRNSVQAIIFDDDDMGNTLPAEPTANSYNTNANANGAADNRDDLIGPRPPPPPNGSGGGGSSSSSSHGGANGLGVDDSQRTDSSASVLWSVLAASTNLTASLLQLLDLTVRSADRHCHQAAAAAAADYDDAGAAATIAGDRELLYALWQAVWQFLLLAPTNASVKGLFANGSATAQHWQQAILAAGEPAGAAADPRSFGTAYRLEVLTGALSPGRRGAVDGPQAAVFAAFLEAQGLTCAVDLLTSSADSSLSPAQVIIVLQLDLATNTHLPLSLL